MAGEGSVGEEPLGDLGVALLSTAQAFQLAASCPRLEASTRLAVMASGAAEALALMRALPGRHAVQLKCPDSIASQVDESEALRALLRHPSLCGLDICFEGEPPSIDVGVWCAAAYAAVVDALSPNGQCEGCTLEHLRIKDSLGDAHQDPVSAFSDAAAVTAAWAGGAATVGMQPLERVSVLMFAASFPERHLHGFPRLSSPSVCSLHQYPRALE
jgi:hypothetical protein